MNKALQVLFDRGFVKDCTDLDQLSDLMDQGPVTFYLGVDPSGASMHIGHTVPVYVTGGDLKLTYTSKTQNIRIIIE